MELTNMFLALHYIIYAEILFGNSRKITFIAQMETKQGKA